MQAAVPGLMAGQQAQTLLAVRQWAVDAAIRLGEPDLFELNTGSIYRFLTTGSFDAETDRPGTGTD